jgi:hypothetical protein
MSVRKARLEVRGPDRILAEEPAALIAHGGVCEGGGFSGVRRSILLYSDAGHPGMRRLCGRPADLSAHGRAVPR